MRTINKLEKALDKAYEDDDMDEFHLLAEELRERDPYNDMFHLGHANWPNCDIAGCGED